MYALTIAGCAAIRATNGESLAGALRRAGVSLSMPCGGCQTCGKCLVWASGGLEEPSEGERALLGRHPAWQPLAPGYTARLACFAVIRGDCDLILPPEPAPLADALPHPAQELDADLPEGLGFAVDIGTTTIALALYDLQSGLPLLARGEGNRQASFGADVLSRIAYADAHGVSALQECIIGQLSDMLEEALAAASACAGRVRRGVLTGNTTMLHLALGLDPHGIGVAPFAPESLFGCEVQGCSVLPLLPPGAALYVPRCVSAYVGADVTCGMLACGLAEKPGTHMLIDVGTNGEMALFSGGRLICCSTAAGPALEGARIAMGMTAGPGAIDQVSVAGNALACRVIGEGPARGICGTGLISAAHALRKCGVIDEGGALCTSGHAFASHFIIHDGGPAFRLSGSGVLLTARDIRELQLAKAAIAAGIDALLGSVGLKPEAVDQIHLAGGFGSAISPEDAAGIGLIPREFAARTRPAGNLALAGAGAMLFSRDLRRRADEIARCAEEISLTTNACFMDQYIQRMLFPEVG